ncbi:hypothetical protein NL676_039861 [Syzygium grande]|nr:hypothetical protein NL676_039861 [Syzygium grande]
MSIIDSFANAIDDISMRGWRRAWLSCAGIPNMWLCVGCIAGDVRPSATQQRRVRRFSTAFDQPFHSP